jgi:2-haloacid dehalogenase
VDVRALIFDVFGTLVDWRSGVAREVTRVLGADVDSYALADDWRGRYVPSMDRVRRGERPWANLDTLHRESLDELLGEFGAEHADQEQRRELVLAWHRLDPWPDTVAGLTRLRHGHVIAPLSNGNVALLVDMAKHAGLPWDCILGAELVRHYKPDREVYQSAAAFLDLAPAGVMMVAAHLGDLRAAKAGGLRTAFVARPLEYGPDGKPDLKGDASVDVSAKDFNDLAAQLGA